MSILFTPIQLGNTTLKNRIIMSPLTRCRADDKRVPTQLMQQYYRQRAGAGLIISEGTSVTPMGVGYPNTPGIWSIEQIMNWQLITEEVHNAGGKIFMQLWHVGRLSDPYYLNGKLPVSSSDIAAQGHVSQLRPITPYVAPKSLSIAEIKETVAQFKKGAQNAKKAGFDGVTIHGANGYLLDQFLQDNCNIRKDEYGGSIENRARFMLEVTDAVCEVWGPEYVGMHLSPRCDRQIDKGDSNPLATFTYAATELGKKKLAFIFSRASISDDHLHLKLKTAFNGNYIINQEIKKEIAEKLIINKEADAVSWGQLFIANPDLVYRLEHNCPLNNPLPEFFYYGGSKGYTDYPVLK
jgi:2,4-dienoyl-CoA reductase-like NADH-dependent reductase (Old Yellow Enzyme family)